MSTGFLASEGCEGESVPGLFPSFCGLLAIFSVSLALATSPQSLSSFSCGVLSVCMPIFEFPLFIKILAVLDSGFLFQYDLILTISLCKNPFPNKITF